MNFKYKNQQYFIVNKFWRVALVFLFIYLLFFPIKSKAEIDSLHRGINVYLHSNPSEKDIVKLKSWGVNTIRLFVHANKERRDYDNIYLDETDRFNEKAFLEIDNLLDLSAKYDIDVILATATFPGSNKEIWNKYSYWNKLEQLYTFIANRYKNHPAVIGYHPIDEASVVRNHGSPLDRLLMRQGNWKFPDSWRSTPKDYFSLVNRVGLIINKIDPNKIVVVSGVGIWGFADNYAWMEKVNVENAVYSFNPYIPHRFANSGKRGKPIVSYNSKEERTELLKKMRPVQEFVKKNNAKIMVVGFGLSFYTEKMGAKEWMHDMLTFFEENNWSWTYFSYGIPFRSPEIVKKKSQGNWIKSETTERLLVLKQFWKLNDHSTSVHRNL